MKKSLLTMVVLIISSLLLAHPASKVEISFNTESKVLELSFSHKVKNVESHYIEEVKVELNGEEIILQSIASQENLEGSTLMYKIPEAKVGDEIEVITKCNKFGKKKAKLTIE